MRLADVVLALAAAPAVCLTGYLFVLALLAAPIAPLTSGIARLFFTLVVPAHNEELGIGATVKSLFALDYPPHLFQILVVADNCTDRTAERAEAAGATVLTCTDYNRRGKGHALRHAFDRILAERLFG